MIKIISLIIMLLFENIEINGKVYYAPQPKQKEFHNAILNREENGYREFLYGGASKGGKSFALRWEAHRNCLQYAGIKVLLLRSSFPELERTHLRLIPFDLPVEVGQYNQQKHIFKYYNDSILEFGYGSSSADLSQYLSANYDVILIDELTTIPFELSYNLRLRLEASRKDFIPFFAAATNPGGKAHTEVRNYFVAKTASSELYPDYNPKRIHFIPATVYDNKILLERDPEVLNRLKQLPYKEQQKYLYGNWDIFEGQFFDNWNPDIHIIRQKDYLDYKQIKGMNILGGLDYGNITVLILGAKDYNGNVIIFDELYHEKETREKKVSETKKFLKERGLENITIAADTNMWNPDAFDMAGQEFPAAYYLRAGIKLIKVSKNASGLNNMSYRKACNEAIYNALDYKYDIYTKTIIKQPKLKIYERCRHLIETLPSLITDDKDSEDIADGQNDHAYDAMKYMFMQLAQPRQKNTDNEPKWLIEMRKERMKKVQIGFMGV